MAVVISVRLSDDCAVSLLTAAETEKKIIGTIMTNIILMNIFPIGARQVAAGGHR